MTSITAITNHLSATLPLSAQESWDNCGLLVASSQEECTGVMLALDVTPEVVTQAAKAGCNLIVSHHPIIFGGIKQLTGQTIQQQAIAQAIRANIAIYSAHTSLDNAPLLHSTSAEMGRLLGLNAMEPFTPSGTGIIGTLPQPLDANNFLNKVRQAFGAAAVRSSRAQGNVSRVVCGSGSCSFLIHQAIAAKADAIVTSDVKYHDFLDYGQAILIADITHFDSEKCAKQIFQRIISEKFTNFAPVFIANEPNPIEFT